MQAYEVPGHAPSLLPEGKTWKLVWADEFDGDVLDTSKWSFRRHLFHREHRGWLGEEGIEFRNSNIVFKLIEKDGRFYSSQIQTGENWFDRPAENVNWPIAPFSQPKFEHRYGYYEVRTKLQKSAVWWTSFWLQSPNIGTHRDEKIAGVEVDIMEGFMGNYSYIPHALHWGGYGKDHQYAATHGFHAKNRIKRDRDSIYLDEGYHTFGCLWEPDGYTFYVDGKLSGGCKVSEGVSHTDQFILLGTECVGYRLPSGNDATYLPDELPEDDANRIWLNNAMKRNDYHGDEFVVDYVRVFDFED